MGYNKFLLIPLLRAQFGENSEQDTDEDGSNGPKDMYQVIRRHTVGPEEDARQGPTPPILRVSLTDPNNVKWISHPGFNLSYFPVVLFSCIVFA